jgi:hypothetical protein
MIAIASFMSIVTIGPKSLKLIDLGNITLLIWGASLAGVFAEKKEFHKTRAFMGWLILSVSILILLVFVLIKFNLFHLFKFTHPLLSAFLPDSLIKLILHFIGSKVDFNLISWILLIAGASGMAKGSESFELKPAESKSKKDVKVETKEHLNIKTNPAIKPACLFILSLFLLYLGSTLPIVKTVSSQTEATISLMSMKWAFALIFIATMAGILGILRNKKWDTYHTGMLLTGIYLSTLIYLSLYKFNFLLVPIPKAISFIYPNDLLNIIASVSGKQISLPWFTWVALLSSSLLLIMFGNIVKKIPKSLIDDQISGSTNRLKY